MQNFYDFALLRCKLSRSELIADKRVIFYLKNFFYSKECLSDRKAACFIKINLRHLQKCEAECVHSHVKSSKTCKYKFKKQILTLRPVISVIFQLSTNELFRKIPHAKFLHRVRRCDMTSDYHRLIGKSC